MWSTVQIEEMDLYSVLFYMRKVRAKQDAKIGKELAQMKLLVMAIHSDPEKLLESIADAEYQADGGYDSEIGDINKLRRFGGNNNGK